MITTNGSKNIFTISCKRGGHKWVSVHEYKADTFADILDSKNAELRSLLTCFQKLGGIKAFEKDNPENEAKLTKYMEQYLEKLIRWVIAGEGGTDNKKLMASHILIHEEGTDTISIHDIDSYVKLLKAKKSVMERPLNGPSIMTIFS